MRIDTLVLGMVRTNCYIISSETTKEAVVIDPADEAERIVSFLEEKGLTLKAILLTHGHFDHITGMKDLLKRFPVKVYAGREEEELLNTPSWNYSGTTGLNIMAKADVWLEDLENLAFGDLECKVIATPGHTKGCVCYYFEKESVLFSGDTLFFESIGRTDLPTGDSRMILQSLNSKLMLISDDVCVYPGHGSQTTIGHERKNNPYTNGNGWE